MKKTLYNDKITATVATKNEINCVFVFKDIPL